MKVEAGVMLFWWLVFGGIHVVLSSRRVRPTLVAGMGEWPFWGAYSIAALATFVPLVAYFFRHKHEGLHFWSARMITHDLTVVLMAFAAALLATGLAARPPSAVMGQASPQVRGILRVTRHPTFAAFFVFGLAHCLVNGFLVDLIFFGGFAVFAWLGAWHQDRRKVVEVPGYAEMKAATSFIPFAAVVRKKQPLALAEINWIAAALGFVVFYAVRAFHERWFGGVF